jgi:hypothetical protein
MMDRKVAPRFFCSMIMIYIITVRELPGKQIQGEQNDDDC